MSDAYFTYILTNFQQTLYTGMTNDIIRRMQEHKTRHNPKSFSAKYNLNKLIYFESFKTAEEAIIREKQIKNLGRVEKICLIMGFNPQFLDLSKKLEELL